MTKREQTLLDRLTEQAQELKEDEKGAFLGFLTIVRDGLANLDEEMFDQEWWNKLPRDIKLKDILHLLEMGNVYFLIEDSEKRHSPSILDYTTYGDYYVCKIHSSREYSFDKVTLRLRKMI